MSTVARLALQSEEPMPLADMLADYQEDPATEALRNLDWEELETGSTSREMTVERALAAGYQLTNAAIAPRAAYTPMTLPPPRDEIRWATLECLGWYCQRWRIEEFFRVLKSGCSTEELTYKTAQRLRRGIAINLVIAWRIMLMTHLGREVPELPMEVLFSDLEIKVLRAYSKKKETSHLPKR